LQGQPDFLQVYLNRILLNQSRLAEPIGSADSLKRAIQRDSLVVCQLYNQKYRDTGRTFVQLQGLLFLKEIGRGSGPTDPKTAPLDTLKTRRQPVRAKERALIRRAKDFFRHLSDYLNPPDPHLRTKFVAAGRGELQATRLVELLYWSTPPAPELVLRQ
jgi:hypothetical protein